MSVSKHDRDYFRRIAEAKAASHAAATAEHLALSLDERLQRSFALSVAHRDANAAPRNDDPSPFYERARRLGLYRG